MSNKQKLQKSTYGIIQKDSSFRKNDKGHLVVKGYFTSDNRDMAGDVITRDATERAIPLYKQWGNVRYLHTPKPVGKVRRIGVQDGLEWNEAEIEIMDTEAIFQVENELLTALSVGILVDFKDIDIDEETGGFVIKDYTLAEISLVDHPANYDAKLKDIVLDDDARHLALQYGLDGLANHIGGKSMTEKEKDVIVEDEIIEETPETEAEKDLDLSELSQEVTPEEVVEEVPAESEAEEVVEEEVDEFPEIEEDIEDSESESQEEIEDVVMVEESADAEIEESLSEEEIEQEEEPAQEDLSEAVQEIRESLKAIVDSLKSGKGSEEEQETDEDDALQKELKAIKEQNEQLEARLKELEESIPGERKGLVAETNIEDLEQEEEVEEVEDVPTLKKALQAHFERKLK